MKKLIDRVHILPLEDDYDIGKHDFRSVLLQPMLSYANLSKEPILGNLPKGECGKIASFEGEFPL